VTIDHNLGYGIVRIGGFGPTGLAINVVTDASRRNSSDR
jgi:hypothetical protein